MSPLCNRREVKRHETALRLQQHGVQFTLERGYDGWTIDDLAEAADVSRRTVFNYFDGKADIVLGPMVELDPERRAVFVAGGPSGNLLDDVLTLAADLIEDHGDHEAFAAGRNAILSDTRLLTMLHRRFEDITAMFVELVRQREGAAFPVSRARLLSRMTAVLFKSAAERAEAEPGRAFADHFADAVSDARAVLA